MISRKRKRKDLLVEQAKLIDRLRSIIIERDDEILELQAKYDELEGKYKQLNFVTAVDLIMRGLEHEDE